VACNSDLHRHQRDKVPIHGHSQPNQSGPKTIKYESGYQTTVRQMIFIEDLAEKARLYYKSDALIPILKSVLLDGTSAVALYRLMRLFVALRLYPLAYVVQVVNKTLNQCLIGARAEFGPGLVLIHPCGVIVNSAVRAGSNVRIESGVVIGNNRGSSPTIGSNVFFGSGAKIIGDLRIGDDCFVGANAVVTKSVPDGHLAIGIPAQNRVRRPVSADMQSDV
jgi:serine O-acetyltransferase